MNLHQLFLTKNDCYKAGRTIIPKGIMVHSTGANNPNLRRYVGPDDGLLGRNTSGNHWNNPKPGGSQVCVHAFIGKLKDGSIATYQTLPWNFRGWHAGGSANDTHIGFEICEPAGHTYRGGTMVGYDAGKNRSYFDAVYRSAVELTAMLCAAYRLDPLADGVVICHSEGYQRGIASNHSDVMQWFPKHGKSMDIFRKDVANRMKGEEDVTQEQFNQMMETYLIQQRDRETSQWAAKAWEQAAANGIFDGTNPQGNLTREQAALVLDRLGLLSKQGGS